MMRAFLIVCLLFLAQGLRAETGPASLQGLIVSMRNGDARDLGSLVAGTVLLVGAEDDRQHGRRWREALIPYLGGDTVLPVVDGRRVAAEDRAALLERMAEHVDPAVPMILDWDGAIATRLALPETGLSAVLLGDGSRPVHIVTGNITDQRLQELLAIAGVANADQARVERRWQR